MAVLVLSERGRKNWEAGRGCGGSKTGRTCTVLVAVSLLVSHDRFLYRLRFLPIEMPSWLLLILCDEMNWVYLDVRRATKSYQTASPEMDEFLGMESKKALIRPASGVLNAHMPKEYYFFF